jgi:hypothetical protein
MSECKKDSKTPLEFSKVKSRSEVIPNDLFVCWNRSEEVDGGGVFSGKVYYSQLGLLHTKALLLGCM